MPGLRSLTWKRRLISEAPPILWVAFSLLCGLTSSAWLIPSPPFAAIEAPWQQAATLAAGGMLALLAGGRPKLPRGLYLRVVGLGILLLTLPLILSDRAQMVNDVTRVALFAAAPICIVMLTSLDQSGLASEQFLLPAVAGLGGLLLVLPVELPHDVRAAESVAMLAAAAGSVAFASARLPAYVQSLPFRSVVVLVCIPNGLLLFVYAGLNARPILSSMTPGMVWSGGLNLFQLALLLYLLRTMQPVRLAARFLVVPLLTTAEGYLILRGPLSARIVSGMVIAASSAAYLLFARPAEDSFKMSLR